MADTKITDLGAITLPAAADIYVTVDDVGVTPITRKITHDDLLFGANTTPSTQAHGDAAAVGNALDAARANHKHAMPTSGAISQANQAAIEGETNENTYMPPDLAHFGPWAAKVWLMWEQSGAHGITASYNMTSVTDGSGAGDTDHLWDTDFSGIGYSVVSQGEWDGTPPLNVGNHAATGIQTINGDSNHSATDFTRLNLAAFGDQ